MNEQICDAIARRAIVTFEYSGKMRRVEPHLLGHNKTGALILSAWQTQSDNDGWRAFSVHKIKNLLVTDEHFATTRPDYNANDSTMMNIICRL